MSNAPPRKTNRKISVSGDSSKSLLAELNLVKQRFKKDQEFSRDTKNSAGPGKVYKKGVSKSLKGHKNKLDNVSMPQFSRLNCF